MTDRRIADLERRNAELEQRYRRLANRKSVKAALALANLAGRVKRSRRAPQSPPSEPVPPPSISGNHLERLDVDLALRLLEVAPPVTVVVPVFNGYEAVERCLASVLAFTTGADEILVIDDASTDVRIGELLSAVALRRGVRVVSNAENLGYVRTVNRAMDETSGDVVLLNADTEVGPRWVERLRIAAYGGADVASVTAVSNNAGAFAVPEIGVDNALRWDFEPSARAVARALAGRVVTTPTANGFCVYLKRVAIGDVGPFDAEKYPRGYGEENDWSMRAAGRGWRHRVDPSTLVAHVRSASFGDERAALASAGAARLDADHPGYRSLSQGFVASPEMAAVRAAVRGAWAGEPPRRRVLSVIHDLAGGTPNSARDLAMAMAADHETLIMRSTGSKLVVEDADGAIVAEALLDRPLVITDRTRPDYRIAVARLLIELDIELVHIRHLMKHTFDLPGVARLLGIPVVMSLHDFYLICPTAHLVDESDRYCAGVCTPGQGICPSSPWVGAGPHLKHGWVSAWQRDSRALLGRMDAVVSASRFTLDLHAERLESVERAVVIPHGRDLPRADPRTEPGAPLRVLLAGTIGQHKGAGLVRAVRALDTEGRIEFHIIGTDPMSCGAVHHGDYRRDEFADKVAEIRPAVLGMFSIAPETWSHTVSEAWACGIPVVATDLGAPAERIRATGAGWLFDPGDVEALYGLLCSIAGDVDDYRGKAEAAKRATWLSTEEMGERYRALFGEVRDARRTVH